MKSPKPGINTSIVEVTNVSSRGFWIILKKKKYFLSFSNFPWFKKASNEIISDVKLLNDKHLYWDKLDVDLELSSIINPEKHPLIFKKG
jgi:hypothetical protein